jgi:hypothetical protein
MSAPEPSNCAATPSGRGRTPAISWPGAVGTGRGEGDEKCLQQKRQLQQSCWRVAKVLAR